MRKPQERALSPILFATIWRCQLVGWPFAEIWQGASSMIRSAAHLGNLDASKPFLPIRQLRKHKVHEVSRTRAIGDLRH
jgi:hypothetical protein